MSLVSLTPAQKLTFDFKNQQNVEEKLTIKNTTNTPVAFKVKTTAPRSYLVRPSAELLPQGGSMDVTIILQPGSLVDSAGNRIVDPTTHRFLVQAVGVEAGRTTNLSKEDWVAMPKGNIQEFKLAVADKPEQTDSLQKRYDELVNYIFKLEQETIQLQEKVKTLRAQSPSGSYTIYHVILAMIIAALFVQAMGMMR